MINYDHPKLCREKIKELYPQLGLAVPKDDTPVPRLGTDLKGASSVKDKEGRCCVRWGAEETNHWSWGENFKTLEDVFSYSPLENADMRGINAKIHLNWSKVKLNMDDLLFHSTISVESGNARQPKLIISKDCFREFLKGKLKKIYAQQVHFENNNVIIVGRIKLIKELRIKAICELRTEDEKRFIFQIKDIILEKTYLPDYLIRLINKKAKVKQVWELPQLIKADSVYFTEGNIVIR